MPQRETLGTAEEELTRQFYDWEIRGRGWQVWSESVQLEPPFRPFIGHFCSSHRGPVDDGRKPTVLSTLAGRIRSVFTTTSNSTSAAIDDDQNEEPEPDLLSESRICELQLAFPPAIKITKTAAENFLLSLGDLTHPISFEVVGTARIIIVQFACGEPDVQYVRDQIVAHFPDAVLTVREDYVNSLARNYLNSPAFVIEFGLSNEFMRPLNSCELEPDPLAAICGAMSSLGHSEFAVLQVLISPAKYPWPESILRAVSDGGSEAFFRDDPRMLGLAGQKISRPLFATVLRIAAGSPMSDRAWDIVAATGSALRQFEDPRSNELIPLSNDGYDNRDHISDLITRRSHRSGLLLNSDELASLVHPPGPSVRTAKLKREEVKTKAAPHAVLGHKLILGENYHGGKTVPVTLGQPERMRHTYVIGSSGTGKSTLLLNLIAQDIQNGEGIAVLDPHGDLIDQILGVIPEERIDDVVLLDPSDEQFPIAFNILSAHSDLERNLLASDLVSVFHRLATSWGDQMNTVLANAILAFLESKTGGTLSDLRRFLVEPEFRAQFLTTVGDSEIVYYWQKEFPLLRGKAQGPILTRLDTFLRPKVIRRMVSQKENRLDFTEMMNGKKILLAKLSQGLIGEENSYLLGTLLVSKLNQAAMSRQQLQPGERKPFYLYIDEFHNFVTPSLAAILSGARKYNLGLILAHQELHQLWSRDSSVASAVVSNPYTRICFRLGDMDAKKFEDGFSFFEAKDLQNLGVGQAICRMERSEYDFNLRTNAPPSFVDAPRRRERIVASSRQQYATRIQDVTMLPSPSPLVQTNVATSPAGSVLTTEQTTTPLEEKATADSAPVTLKRPNEPSSPGRGGPQHKYLQELIRRWAEDRGYRVTVEKQILDGLGSVDVALEKADVSIACEISVTTSAEHEFGNIQKCLAAGFNHVVALATNKKTLKAIAAVAAGLAAQELERVSFLLPEELFSFLEERDAQTVATEQTVRGYKVKVKRTTVSEEDQKIKKQAIAHTIMQAMRRVGDKSQKNK